MPTRLPSQSPSLPLFGALLLSACAHAGPGSALEPDADALASIRAEDIAAHVAVLASDAYEGRFPGSAGEAKTVSYLAASFARLGLAPASETGYLQPVPLTALKVDPSSAMTLTGPDGPGGERRLVHGEDLVFGAPGDASSLTLASEGLVFAGYGIVAPEHGWDDYAGVDVRGKTVLVLSGDPGPTRSDPSFFKGLALTHHGTTKAKLERARERGAAALLVLHDEAASGLPWAVLAQNSKQTKMQLRTGADAATTLVGALPITTGRELLASAGVDVEAAFPAAAADGFRARVAALPHRFDLRRTSEAIDSHNVVGWIRGSERPDEYVVYTAHWDHVGVAPEGAGKAGDRIFNGAVDNATGTAALLELAEAFAAAPTPRRSVVFLATTAEEQGLLGASYYTEDPLFPLADTVAVINMDALFPFGPTKGMTVVALGSSEIEEYMDVAARAVGRRLYPDPAPQLGAFFRSDHYPFAAKGVPAIFAVGGPASDPDAGETVDLGRFMDYVGQHYHQVSDEYDPDRWDLGGIVQDVEVYFRTGWAIANDERRPAWYPDSEFRALREG